MLSTFVHVHCCLTVGTEHQGHIEENSMINAAPAEKFFHLQRLL